MNAVVAVVVVECHHPHQEAYFNFEPLAESRGFLYVHPDGTVDATGEQYWNATDACCSFGSDVPDDATYLLSIIEQVSAE